MAITSVSPVDLFCALGLIGLTALILWSVSGRIGVERLPALILLTTVFPIGAFLFLPTSPFFLSSDGLYYQEWGFAISRAWSGEPSDLARQQVWPGKGVWPALIATFHAAIGPVTLSLIAFNSAAMAATTVVLQKTILFLSGHRAKWSLVVFVLSSPSFVIFGPSILRESLFWLGTSLGILAISSVRKTSMGKTIASTIAGVVLVLAIRPDAGLVVAWFFVGLVTVLLCFSRYGRSPRRVIAGTVVLGVLVSTMPTTFEFVRPNVTPAVIQNAAEELSAPSVETAFSSIVRIPMPESCDRFVSTKLVCSSISHLPAAMFGPFYWEYRAQPIWFASGLSGLHFLAALALALFYLFGRENRNLSSFGIIVVAAASLFMFASIITNYGALIRFRAATELMLTPVAMSGYAVLARKLAETRDRRTT